MTQHQLKEQLTILLDLLPPDQAELVLDFATLLRQRQTQFESEAKKTQGGESKTQNINAWEAALAAAEEYWFHLPEATRQKYAGHTVALLHNRILDSDLELKTLRKRVWIQYPDQPILYLDAAAEQEPPLFVRSPRLR